MTDEPGYSASRRGAATSRNENVSSALQANFPSPDKPFIRLMSGQVMNYGEMDHLSAVYAAVLHVAGIRKGDIVAVLLDKSP
jgi:acyl-CoA synthetase (AMP-forming)/AMP-acid ligase II